MGSEDKVGEIIGRLERLERSMNRAVDKLERVERRIPPRQIGKSEPPLDVGTLLSIPDHPRTTLLTVASLGNVDADTVSLHTGKKRAAKSKLLNELVLMGHLRKYREGRQTLFSLK